MKNKSSHSDIFEAYAKSMENQGLIVKSAADEESGENPRKPKPTQPDWDAYSYFYPKKEMLGATLDMDGKPYDMLDKAHPETIVVSPAYDAMNGVVENLKERNNVMTMIALKTPKINQINERYVKALEDMLDETIKLGFYLDSKGLTDLAVLADTCSEQIHKKARAPLAIAGIVAGVAAIGGLLAWNSANPVGVGMLPDLKAAIEETSQMINGKWYNDYPQLAPVLEPAITSMTELVTDISSFYEKTNEMEKEIIKIKLKPESDEKNKLLSEFGIHFIQSGVDKQITNLAKKIKDNSLALIQTIPVITRIIKEAPEKYDEGGHWYSTFTNVFWDVVGRDTDDAARALDVVSKSAPALFKQMNTFINEMEEIKSQVGYVDFSNKKENDSLENLNKKQDDKKQNELKEKQERQRQLEMFG